MQSSPSDPKKPSWHTQSDNALAPATDSELTGHDVQLSAPGVSVYNPAWQREQVSADVAPIPDDADPAEHSVHECDPLVSLYLPAEQLAQSPPFGPVKPASHTQSVSARLPAGETVAVGHDVQSTAPLEGLKVPAGHWKHGPPSGPVLPAAHED